MPSDAGNRSGLAGQRTHAAAFTNRGSADRLVLDGARPIRLAADQPVQFVHVDRFCHVSIETGGRGSSAIEILRITGHGNEYDALQVGVGTKTFAEFESVHDRQAEIQQRHTGFELFDDGQGRWSIVSDLDEVSERTQRIGKQHRGILVVVDDQQAMPRRSDVRV